MNADEIRSGPVEAGEGADGPTPLEGLASGGLIGFLTAFDRQVDEDRDASVDDPEALRRAEEAVARDEPVPDGPQAPIDEDWAVVARQTGVVVVGLDEVARILEADGVPIGWDPYDPRDSVAFLPPGMGSGVRSYALVVPESQYGHARRILEGVTPQGVTYEWGGAAYDRPAHVGEDFGDTAGSGAPTAVTGYGGGLSDNERLRRLAGGGPSVSAVGVAVALGIVAVLVVLFLVLRG